MYLVNYKSHDNPNKKTFKQILQKINIPEFSKNYFTIISTTNQNLEGNIYVHHYKEQLQLKLQSLAERCGTTEKQYMSFRIPKASGGFREINAPENDTKQLLSDIKDFFQNQLRLLPSNYAYAYVEGRCAKDAIIPHVRNNSIYYLKLDIKNFFPCCTKEMVLDALNNFQSICQLDAATDIATVVDYCILNGGLPQGSPASPFLTNMIMTNIDLQIAEYCKNNQLIYTRYADDMLISCKETFDQRKVRHHIQQLLPSTLFINNEKIRYGSNKGRNWNLGLMVNKDNNITIGYRSKERFRAMINNFLYDLTTGKIWTKIEVQQLIGIKAYYESINKETIDNMIEKLERKYNKNLNDELKEILRM